MELRDVAHERAIFWQPARTHVDGLLAAPYENGVKPLGSRGMVESTGERGESIDDDWAKHMKLHSGPARLWRGSWNSSFPDSSDQCSEIVSMRTTSCSDEVRDVHRRVTCMLADRLSARSFRTKELPTRGQGPQCKSGCCATADRLEVNDPASVVRSCYGDSLCWNRRQTGDRETGVSSRTPGEKSGNSEW